MIEEELLFDLASRLDGARRALGPAPGVTEEAARADWTARRSALTEVRRDLCYLPPTLAQYDSEIADLRAGRVTVRDAEARIAGLLERRARARAALDSAIRQAQALLAARR